MRQITQKLYCLTVNKWRLETPHMTLMRVDAQKLRHSILHTINRQCFYGSTCVNINVAKKRHNYPNHYHSTSLLSRYEIRSLWLCRQTIKAVSSGASARIHKHHWAIGTTSLHFRQSVSVAHHLATQRVRFRLRHLATDSKCASDLLLLRRRKESKRPSAPWRRGLGVAVTLESWLPCEMDTCTWMLCSSSIHCMRSWLSAQKSSIHCMRSWLSANDAT